MTATATRGVGEQGSSTRLLHRLALPTSIVGLAAVAFLALFVGDYALDVRTVVRILASPVLPVESSWNGAAESAILKVRVPRILAAILVGGALSVSGATYQSVFRNPLVSPDLLGVSAGACVGAAGAILLHLGQAPIALAALLGGLAAVACSTGLARVFRENSSLVLVLAGVIVSGFMNSALGLLKYLADPETELASITYWQLGSLSGTSMTDVTFVAVPIVLGTAVLIVLRWRLGILSLGDAEAALLGTDVVRLRAVAVLCATVLTACAVCVSGTIGWIGLVVPHLCRFLTGPDTARVVPLSVCVGALFLLAVDTLARTMSTAELPLSILIGFVGTPLFVWLVVRQRSTLR
ncbi:iron ABC transporter permease [Brooklawnia cerclae]|uniref:Iron complex transport system permease protein n=1 Tax=Brooklawnia cerclae TaxID=349934 RepID=A0ABX0SDT7_9ACTN|nr:iron ABC transporter permease [Brooklawnia cerclae]NIH56563.1 iron complex transport system permease protein [Brooklawnia cerclae]